MERYIPKFKKCFRTDRADNKERTSYWVQMPNGDNYNIWDISKKNSTQEVEDALVSAFERGMIAYRMMVQDNDFTVFHKIETVEKV